MKTLNKQQLFNILSSRFEGEEKKLSQIPNPALLQDAEKSAKKIADAIRENKKTTLVCDYDIDGVSSCCAIMVDFFRQIPYPFGTIIPNRFHDGYGINQTVLQRVNADLVVAVGVFK